MLNVVGVVGVGVEREVGRRDHDHVGAALTQPKVLGRAEIEIALDIAADPVVGAVAPIHFCTLAHVPLEPEIGILVKIKCLNNII